MSTVLGNVIIEEALTVNGKDVEEIAKSSSLNSNTGTITGGVLSIASSTEFNISAGEGVIVSILGNTATETKVVWNAFNNITATNIATEIVTNVFINSSGDIVQQGAAPTPEQLRTLIYLGRVIHLDNATINSVTNDHFPIYQSMQNNTDLIKTIGVMNKSGNEFTPNGNNLSINKSAGVIFSLGSNFTANVNDPNFKTIALANSAAFSYRFQNSTTLTSTTNINPAIYDLNNIQTAVPGNKYTLQRVYLYPTGGIRIQLGQFLYDSLTQAKLAINSEPFVTEANNAADACLRAVIIVKGDATDLSNPNQAIIFNANKFGEFDIGKSVTDLQSSYTNSTDGVITTTTTNNAVKLKRGTALDTDNVLEVLNGAGSTTFYVKGNGSSSVDTLLNGKANTSHTHVSADITDLSKSSVGLANVQNVDQTNASNITSGTLGNARLTANLSQIGGLTLTTNDFLQFNGTVVTNVTPTQVKTSIGLNNVSNNLQVINAGNGVSFASGVVSARPTASTNGRFYASTDSGPYLDNGSSWLPLQVAITGDISISANGTTATLPNVNSNIGIFNNVTVNSKGQVIAASNVSYLTANQNITVTGDISGSGTNALSLTLPNVNSNIGAFNNVTVNSKGQVTAASNVSYLTANQNITVTGDISGSGTNALSLTLPNVNSNIGSFGGTTSIPQFTVNSKGLITAASSVTPNLLLDSGLNGILVRTSANNTSARTLVGTANQITITNADGVSLNPTFALASDTIIPGTGGIQIPIGTTAERPGIVGNGLLRYNNTLAITEIGDNGVFRPLGKVIQFITNDITQTTGTTILPYDATLPTSTEGFQIWSTTITPYYTNSKIVVMYNIFTEVSVAVDTMVSTALFNGTTCISTNSGYSGIANTAKSLTINKSFVSGTTSPITISARSGPSVASTMYVNRGITETFAGTTNTSYIIMEII